MTKKDFELIADTIHKLCQDLPITSDKLIAEFTKLGVNNNPRFKPGKFVCRCLGLEYHRRLDEQA